MKIGFNYKSIKNFVMVSITQMANMFSEALNSIQSNINNLDTRITDLKNSNNWIEITSSNELEAEITQEFTEIRLLAKCSRTSYSITYNYSEAIFHNSSGYADTYMICGNPIENNYGCKFKYMKHPITGKQYVCVDKCFNGGSEDAYTFRAWIKPTSSIQ